ncbi:MAG TPA: ABC transporter substrate-binding protein [Nitrososphaerales archaeon]|nr:ABC transporter substrate-binding protein [Nitrososphaerales archaeon]
MAKVKVYTSFSFMLDTFDVSLRARYPDDHLHLITFRDHPKMVYERIVNEVRDTGHSADIVIAPHWLVMNLQLQGLLREYQSPEFSAYPERYFDSKAGWCGMALSPVGMVYNTSKLDEKTAPSGLAEATEKKWSGKLAIHEITENKEGQMGLTYLTVLRKKMGEKRWADFVKSIYAANPTTYDCMPEMALNVGLGRSDVGFPATLSCVAYYLEVQNRPVKHRMPDDVPYMVTFAPTIAILKDSETPDWAEKAFDFGLSEDWQSRVESFGGKIPTRTGVPATGSVPEDSFYFPSIEDAKDIQETLSQVRKLKADN